MGYWSGKKDFKISVPHRGVMHASEVMQELQTILDAITTMRTNTFAYTGVEHLLDPDDSRAAKLRLEEITVKLNETIRFLESLRHNKW